MTRLTANSCRSVVVSVLPDDTRSIEAMIHSADAALYQAMRGGRNRVFAGEYRKR